jgi:catechol 2,3-dioxygenase-like lactoylglutathione lyase family enzyme
MAVRRLNHAVLYVHGLQRTVDFYRAALGFEVRLEIPGRAAFLRAPGSANDHDLGLFEIGTGPERQAPDQPEHPGLYHLAWEVGTLADLADTREKLVQAGALVGESDHRVSKSLYAKDPSGIEFEVMWRVPAQDWAAELADGEMILPLDLDAAIARWGQDQATGATVWGPIAIGGFANAAYDSGKVFVISSPFTIAATIEAVTIRALACMWLLRGGRDYRAARGDQEDCRVRPEQPEAPIAGRF